jgi:N-acetylmuramoyl-L-alanine amidase
MDDGAGGIVVHHTGVGVRARAERMHTTPTAAALYVYQQIMNESGHYVVGEEGDVYQIVPEDHVASHAGRQIAETTLYRAAAWKLARPWWGVRWADYKSPMELLVPGRSGNAGIGIELVSPPAGEPYTEAQYASLIALCREIMARHPHVEWRRETLLGHCDVNPARRGTRKGPWDPSPLFDWARLWAETIGVI